MLCTTDSVSQTLAPHRGEDLESELLLAYQVDSSYIAALYFAMLRDEIHALHVQYNMLYIAY